MVLIFHSMLYLGNRFNILNLFNILNRCQFKILEKLKSAQYYIYLYIKQKLCRKSGDACFTTSCLHIYRNNGFVNYFHSSLHVLYYYFILIEAPIECQQKFYTVNVTFLYWCYFVFGSKHLYHNLCSYYY